MSLTTTVTATFAQMTVPIESGHVYQIQGVFPYRLHNATAGFRLGFLFPAVQRAAVIGMVENPLLSPQMLQISDTGQSYFVSSGTSVQRSFTVQGTLLCSGSGNLMVFGLSELSDRTADVLDGASFTVWKLGPV